MKQDAKGEQIFTIPVGGGTPTKVTSSFRNSRFPDYSPDGTRIAYERSDANGLRQIYTVPSTGGQAYQGYHRRD